MPEVGTLYIERQGARKISTDKLLSPRNVVRFSSKEQAPSLVAEIVNIAGCGVEQAQDIYDRWLQKVRIDGKVVIGDIGSIQNQSFTVEPSFNSAINPSLSTTSNSKAIFPASKSDRLNISFTKERL